MLVPDLRLSPQAHAAHVQALCGFVADRRVAVLTGAGCSTESGIPDYRGPGTRRRARTPIRFMQFVRNPEARKRYWARAMVGWRRFHGKQPNAAHRALAELEHLGQVTGIITQNVDDLHERAGSRRVIPLHGTLSEVRCLACECVSPRVELQARLADANPAFVDRTAGLAPDGDAELPDALVAEFVVVDCQRCGGPLKPRVVFFGENVPKPRVEAAFAMCDEADALLVVGSSLEVFSGYRFVRHMVAQGRPVAIVNVGPTRGDGDATLRIEALAGEVLPPLATRLSSPRGGPRPI